MSPSSSLQTRLQSSEQKEENKLPWLTASFAEEAIYSTFGGHVCYDALEKAEEAVLYVAASALSSRLKSIQQFYFWCSHVRRSHLLVHDEIGFLFNPFLRHTSKRVRKWRAWECVSRNWNICERKKIGPMF